MTGRLQMLTLVLATTWSFVLFGGCNGDGGGDGASGGADDGGGTGLGSGMLEQCTVTLTPDDPSAETGDSLGVTARLDARIREGGSTREIVNETSVSAFDWMPSSPLEEVPNAAVGTKKFYTANSAGSYDLKVTSKLSSTCSANVNLTFTGGETITDPFPAGTYDNVTFFALNKRSDGSRTGCDPAEGMTLTIEKTGDTTARATLTGSLTCGLSTLTCVDRIADLSATATQTTTTQTTTPVSGSCSLSGSDTFAADKSYTVKFEKASQFYPTRYVARMDVVGSSYTDIELAFPLP